MKLRWYNRMLLILASLFLLVQSVIIGLLALGYGHNEFYYIAEMMLAGHWINRVILCVLAVIVFAVALRLLFLRSKKNNPNAGLIFMCSTDSGAIRITPMAVEALVKRASKDNDSVRDLKVKIYQQDNSLHMQLRVMIIPGAIIKDVSAQLQKTVREAVENSTGIPVPEVQVIIEAMPVTSAAIPVE